MKVRARRIDCDETATVGFQPLDDNTPCEIRTLEERVAILERKIEEVKAARKAGSGADAKPKYSILVTEIAQLVAWRWKMPIADIFGNSRASVLLKPRSAVVIIARTVTDRSYPQIGEVLGGRHHSSIMHLHEKAKLFEIEEPDFRRRVQSVIEDISRKEKS